MKSKIEMTKQEAQVLLKEMEKVFDVVRILDEELSRTIEVRQDELVIIPHNCYEVLHQSQPCVDCIGREALRTKSQKSRFQRIHEELHYVAARYVEIDQKPYVIEMMLRVEEKEFDRIMDSLESMSSEEYKDELYLDALTGSYNRRYYEKKMKDDTTPSGVAILDLDDFKLCNDTFGHQAGDCALRNVVKTMKQVVGSHGIVVRYGGDEFIIVMPLVSEGVFNVKLDEIREKIHELVHAGCEVMHLSVSIGGVLSHGETIEDALQRADHYLYRAKTLKNSVSTELIEKYNEEYNSERQRETGKQLVLLVDEIEEDRKILREILEADCQIMEAGTESEAMALTLQHKEENLLVLLSIQVSGGKGLQLLERMYQEPWFRNVSVIITYENGFDERVKQAYEMGVMDCIKKPFQKQEVYHRVRNISRLSAKQRKLIGLLTNQIYEREKNNHMMLGILNKSMEIRNGESGQHAIHINVLTEMLLDQLLRKTDRYEISWEDRMAIITASSLHDIGKMGINWKILNKPEALTPQEREIMESHTTIGAEIIEELKIYQDENLMKIAYEICRWHHERYDGKGYPDGLSGDDIPISALIVSLADVFDALISNRCYREKFSYEEALAMIKNGECGAFNPILVECLEDLKEEIQSRMNEGDKERSSQEISAYNAKLNENAKKQLLQAVSVRLQKEEQEENGKA